MKGQDNFKSVENSYQLSGKLSSHSSFSDTVTCVNCNLHLIQNAFLPTSKETAWLSKASQSITRENSKSLQMQGKR